MTLPKPEHVWNVERLIKEDTVRYPLFATEKREPKRR